MTTTPDRSPGTGTPMRPARERTGSGLVPVLAAVLALALLALAVVLVRDALVALGAVGGEPWLPAAVGSLDGTAPSAAVVAVGAVAALLGLWLLAQALRRRTRRSVAVASQTGVFTGTRDVARLASGAARQVDGVVDARSTATRRSVDVRVGATGVVEDLVTAAVTERLSVLDPAPRVRVRTTTSGSHS